MSEKDARICGKLMWPSAENMMLRSYIHILNISILTWKEYQSKCP